MSAAQPSSFIYVGNSESQDITVLEMAPSGDLKAVTTVPVPGPSKPGGSLPLAVAPDKRFLYVGLRNEPYSVATFALDPGTGVPRYVGSGSLADSMACIATDRTGRFLLCASYGGDKVTINALGENGVVGPLLQTITDVSKAHCILTDPSNRFVLFTSLGGDLVYQHAFDARTGKMSPNVPASRGVTPKAGPRHLVFSPDARFVYLLNELDASVHVFPCDTLTGTLGDASQVVPTVPSGFDGKPAAADIHVTPDGNFLYSSERTTSTLTAFRVDRTSGRLTRIDTFPTARQPRAFQIDPTGRFLYAAGQLSNSLIGYSIDGETGRLTKRGEYPTGKNPNWIEIVTLP